MAQADAAALGSLRLAPGFEVAESGAEVWLRGPQSDEAWQTKLAAVPAQQRYELLPPDQLRQLGQRVPSGPLPKLSWQPLNAWLRVETPIAALPAEVRGTSTLRLVRSAEERDSELLLTTLEIFAGFAAQAPEVRLARLRFAATADGRVLIHGTPLPPLPGQRFSIHHGIAVPAGFTWQPAVSGEVLAHLFRVSDEALILWNDDGSITRLHGEQFIPATRSAVRATRLAAKETE